MTSHPPRTTDPHGTMPLCLSDRDLLRLDHFSLREGVEKLDPARLNAGTGRIVPHSNRVMVEFGTTEDAGSISQQLRFSLPEARMANGMGLRLRIRGWKSISYIGIGHTDENRYCHVKAGHPRQDHWFDFCVGFADLAWGWRNDWDHPEDRPVSDIRFYIKGVPGPEAGLDITDFYLWQETPEPDAIFGEEHRIPADVMQSLSDYNRSYFPNAVNQMHSFMEEGKCPLIHDTLINWRVADSRPDGLEGNNTYQYSWHALHPALILMLSALETKKAGPVFAARDLVSDWLTRSYDTPDPNVKYAWYDHGVAERLLTFITLYGIGQDYGFDSRFMTRLRRAIHSHAQLLASEVFYAGHQSIRYHNHAWFQDFALIATGLAFPGWAPANYWIDLALERIGDQFAALIVRDGDYAVLAENSIGYHRGIQRLVSKIDVFASLSGRQTDIPAILAGMSGFSTLMHYPDGKRFPAQGDTFRLPLPPEGDPGGKRPWPTPEVAILPHAGYGIARGNHEGRPFSLIFLATALSATHKHADNLSFTLYLDGIEWLIDPSFHSHEYARPLPAWLRGPEAHNAFILPGADYAITPGRARMTGWQDDGAFHFEGHHDAVTDCKFRREINGRIDRLDLTILDELLQQGPGAPPAEQARLMLQCGDGVTATITEGEIRLTHPASDLSLLISLPGARIRSFHGQEEDPVCGITGLGFLEAVPITTIRVEPPEAGAIQWELRAEPCLFPLPADDENYT
ncbi:MAG: heparinase II/III family protein [Pseudorhodobacter sp.]